MTIDGSYGEGGGQILRTSLAMAGLLGRRVDIVNIRRGRKRPGLQPQHLTAVRAMARITRAQVAGADLGSTRLIFEPQSPVGGEYEFDVAAVKASAGSVSLVFQAVAPALFAASRPSQLRLKGGTHVPWSPPVTYLQSVFLPALGKLGLQASLEIEQWGWYPEGGGVVRAALSPAPVMSPLRLERRGDLQQIECLSVVSNLPISIAERQRDQVLRRLRQKGLSAVCEVVDAPSNGKGTFVFLLARYQWTASGFSALGRRGRPAERVADDAVWAFWAFHTSGAAVDKYLADQLLIYLALAEGRSIFTTSEITPHLLTNIWVIEQFLPVMFSVEGEPGQPGLVAVK